MKYQGVQEAGYCSKMVSDMDAPKTNGSYEFGSGTLTRGAIPLCHLIKMFSISKFSAFLTLGSGSGFLEAQNTA